MKQMKSYRLDEVTLARLNTMAESMHMSNTEMLESLLSFGFDVYYAFITKSDAKSVSDRFVASWREQYLFHNPKG